ncbi:MinD/ParA family protein [Fervidibacillus halotolerans]|uniref:MinD/ParA family protein n=1 Tax=Fervidibacillus halotolerans TaxID=2980027 RepID=A0A9E8M179_9BACI|nr:MinD/ParA family protein [Fervidibacillus halotolerans]WAA13585.1 MinD/ParA family protein [Fervidibacillus halotolerans]
MKMHDQAEKLRQRLRKQISGKYAQTIAIISGKGGVGKSNISLNFSISLAKSGKRVLLFDLDIGMGNIDLLTGMTAKKNLSHFFNDNLSLEQIIERGPEGIFYIAGGTGLNQLIMLNEQRLAAFLREIQRITYEYDYFIFDLGAGMTKDTVHFLTSVDHIITIVTPEPTSIMDAYSSIKYILSIKREATIYLLGNRIHSTKERKETVDRLSTVIQHFLHKRVEIIGTIPEDHTVMTAVKKQTPILILAPKSPAAKSIEKVANYFLKTEIKNEPKQFVEKLKSFLLRK